MDQSIWRPTELDRIFGRHFHATVAGMLRLHIAALCPGNRIYGGRGPLTLWSIGEKFEAELPRHWPAL